MQDNKWFVPVKVSKKARNQLFAFHHAAASASTFYGWSQYLNEYTTLYAIELPGRASRLREEAISDIGTIARNIAQGIKPYLGTMPTFFFGHSMGGILAYETAVLLSSNSPIDHFIASAVSPPGYRQISIPIHNLDDEMFKKELIRYGGIPENLLTNIDFWDIYLPLARADFSMIANYTSFENELPLNWGITAIVGKTDSIVRVEKAQHWQKFTKNNFDLIEINGGHLFIQDKKNIVEVINTILLRSIRS